MTICSNCGVYEAQPDGLCVKCQSITNNEIMAFSIARQATDDRARLQAENARLREALGVIASGANLADEAEKMGIDTSGFTYPIESMLAIARKALEGGE